jgi:hypothetical protein
MPDVQEVFRLATQKVRPEPGALERQFRKQRQRAVGQKVAVYALVAAFVLAAIVIAVTRLPANHSKPAGHTPSISPIGTRTQLAEVVALDGSVLQEVPAVPEGAQELSLSPDGTTIAFSDSNVISTVRIEGTGMRELSGGKAGVVARWLATRLRGDLARATRHLRGERRRIGRASSHHEQVRRPVPLVVPGRNQDRLRQHRPSAHGRLGVLSDLRDLHGSCDRWRTEPSHPQPRG